MADLVVVAILVVIGYWAVRQLRDKGSSCCSQGKSCSCSKKSCEICAEKNK